MFEDRFDLRSPWVRPAPRAVRPLSMPAGTHVGLDSWMPEWQIPCYEATARNALRPVLYNPHAWSNVANGRFYRPPARRDFVAKARAFADATLALVRRAVGFAAAVAFAAICNLRRARRAGNKCKDACVRALTRIQFIQRQLNGRHK